MTQEEFDYVLIGCQPYELGSALEKTKEEEEIFGPMKTYSFFTTNVKAKKRADQVDHGTDIFSEYGDFSKALTKSIQGMREEWNARNPDKATPIKGDTAFYTVYQADRQGPPHDPAARESALNELRKIRDAELADKNNLFHLERDPSEEPLEQYVSYFPHFEKEQDLANIWKLLHIQGNNRTFWISSTASFESVLQIHEYQELVFEMLKNSDKFPKSGARVAIIGAGPSGLLWAYALVRLNRNYKITIYDKAGRIGGKTMTVPRKMNDSQTAVCELGTCYLSNAYLDFYEKILKDLVPDNKLVPLGKAAPGTPLDIITEAHNLRTTTTEHFFPLSVKLNDKIVDSVSAMLHIPKGFFQLDMKKWPEDPHDEWRLVQDKGKFVSYHDFVGQSVFANLETVQEILQVYIKEHQKLMGTSRPIPIEKPTHPDFPWKMSYYEWLMSLGMDKIVRILRYAYQHQGYGIMEEIPAVYGLIWITPDAVRGAILNTILHNPPVVWCFQKGWYPFWVEVQRRLLQNHVNIKLNSNVQRIVRDSGKVTIHTA